jgi:hypothetical protein
MEAHSPQPAIAAPGPRRLPGPVLFLAVALALFLAGGVTATALGFAARSPIDRCASVAEGVSNGLDLSGADLTESMLAGAELCGADLRGTIFERACLRGVRLEGADLTGAVLTGADMTGAKTAGTAGLPEDLPQVESACD